MIRRMATGRSMCAKSETPFKTGAKQFGGSHMKTGATLLTSKCSESSNILVLNWLYQYVLGKRIF